LTVGVGGEAHPLLRDVGFQVDAGEIVGLVGESGSGKTMTSLALMGLLPPAIELRSGSILLGGRQLVEDRAVGRTSSEMTMIFQHPRGALNPTMRVGRQVARVLQINQGLDAGRARELAVDLISRVGISGGDRVARAYPHQLSGGMCQRIMIAMALGCRPKILIADEPTTALDVTIQAQIFDLIRDLVAETSCGVLFITHDLAAVAEMCDRIVVMYGGQVMEQAATRDLFERPQHPYTRYLLESVEREVDPRAEEKDVDFTLSGCRFAHRCGLVFERCVEFPPRVEVADGHLSACFRDLEESYVAC
jgi:peptide/nickel transport system ATP-binding protein